MSWLFVILLAYFLLGLASLFDRYLLAGPLPNPMVYACLTGLLGGLAFFLIPFGFDFPGTISLLTGLLAGFVFIIALYLLFLAIYSSEVSRAVPVVGALLPVFSLLLVLFFASSKPVISPAYLFSFILLVLGSAFITWEKDREFNLQGFGFSGLAAVFFALAFFLMKKVYLEQPFLSGFIWMRAGGFLAGLGFLLFSKTRSFFKQEKAVSRKKISLPFLLGQVFGGSGFVLQNYAVNLVSFDKVPLINALEGTRYVFLLFLVFILGRRWPQLLKEEIKGRVLWQKIIAIGLICSGLGLLAFI